MSGNPAASPLRPIQRANLARPFPWDVPARNCTGCLDRPSSPTCAACGAPATMAHRAGAHWLALCTTCEALRQRLWAEQQSPQMLRAKGLAHGRRAALATR
jgi:hypothetical protein